MSRRGCRSRPTCSAPTSCPKLIGVVGGVAGQWLVCATEQHLVYARLAAKQSTMTGEDASTIYCPAAYRCLDGMAQPEGLLFMLRPRWLNGMVRRSTSHFIHLLDMMLGIATGQRPKVERPYASRQSHLASWSLLRSSQSFSACIS